MEVVAVDIGGTHARFAIARMSDDGAITLGEPVTLHTHDHASFQTAWEDYKERMGGHIPSDVALAIAGPITDDIIRFTNNPCQ
jgi:glucokinase